MLHWNKILFILSSLKILKHQHYQNNTQWWPDPSHGECADLAPWGVTTDHCTSDTLPPPAHQWLIISKQSPTQNIRIFYTAAHSWLFHNIFTRILRKKRERDNRKEPGVLSPVSSLGVFLSTQFLADVIFTGRSSDEIILGRRRKRNLASVDITHITRGNRHSP